MRKLDWTIVGITIFATAFWLVVLRPRFLQGPMERAETVLSHVSREYR